MRYALAILAIAAAFAGPASAQVPMNGRFTAEATCAATASIREPAANPGRVSVESGRSYALLGRNAVPGSHYLILVPEAEPARRWVAYGCGRVEDENGSQSAAAEPPAASGVAKRAGRYVLAASWHPAFCQTRPRRSECRDGGSDEGFSLHGLWPQPRGREYCDVAPAIEAADRDGDWLSLPAPQLTAGTRADLARVMPGVVAGLDRHEWWRHGTCHGGDAEAYFADGIRLIDALNASDVAALFVGSIGGPLSAREIRAAFDTAFGRGAGRRILVDCTGDAGRELISELRIELSGVLSADESLAALILAAPTVPPGCPMGDVDAAG